MPQVRLLSEEVANKIAAGEVVERPASAVRELVENALDAEASQVRVETAGGGLELVRVADDGWGMDKDDCLLALERHATSKIAAAEDLFRISTLGFRGEALPSLAAVCRLSIVSRRRQDTAATFVRAEGGEVRETGPCGRAPGTTVEAAELFFNTPARRKFLSSPAREAALISETLSRYAMAHPRVRFRLESAGRSVLNLPPAATRRERLAACLGRRLAAELICAHREAEGPLGLAPGVELEAFLAPPELSRASARQALFFLNGRPIRDRLLFHALMRAYEGLLTSGRYPVALLFLRVDPAAVDVNVHPAKAEVRFRDHRRLGDLLARALRGCLECELKRPARIYLLEEPPAEPRVAEPPAAQLAWPSPAAPGEAPPPPASPAAAAREGQPSRPATWEAAAGAEELVLIGQFRASYLLCQAGGDLLIIDQHAAHERVLFEELEAAAASGSPAVQELLFPAVVELDARQARTLEANAQTLAEAGLVAEPFGGRSAAVKALPQALAGGDAEALLRDVLDQLGEGEGGGGSGGLDGRRHALLALLACKAAVKAGQPLSGAEAQALIFRLSSLKVPYCPHGRPIMRRIPLEELARLFRR
jgi:DNA mismatch repair protein MutL